MKANSSTNIRPVFDAPASERWNLSLNQCLEKGPNLMELVPPSLDRFHEREIVVSLRFLWLVDGYGEHGYGGFESLGINTKIQFLSIQQ